MVLVPKVETVQPLASFIFSARDAIEILFELSREVIIHQVRKALLEQTGNGESNPLGNQRGSAPEDITAIDNHRNDRRIR